MAADADSNIRKVFRAVCCIATFLTTRHGSQCDAKKLIESVSRQLGHGVTLLDLAKIKYLLPDEVVLEYQDTPIDVVFGQPPHEILVFDFNDKKAQSRRKSEIPALIKRRISRFETALEQFLRRRGSLTPLGQLALRYLPREDPLDNFDSSNASNPISLEEICHKLQDGADFFKTIPSRKAEYGIAPPLALKYNYPHVYSHQCKAWESLESGKSVVITTSTASGKSLVYQLAVREMLDTDPNQTALFLFPTKALGQDQRRAFAEMAPEAAKKGWISTFDGDTPWQERIDIMDRGRVLFANPDILHATMLPRWREWLRFLSNLRFVIIDELHTYDGVFGAHMAMIMRRLRRIAWQIGNDSIIFIGCSATVAEPRELLMDITGLSPESIDVVDHDGSPSGAKHYIFRTPEYMTPEDPQSGRLHPISEAVPAIGDLIDANLRTIVFTRYRKECEMTTRALYDKRPDLKEIVRSYRGGYQAKDRRAIERQMFGDELRGIVATSALEVGVDIGSLDAAVLVGFPYTVAKFRQQVGRVGRRNRDSVVLYVADGSVMDQSYISNPAKIFECDNPKTQITMHDALIRLHMQCAAHELALDPAEDLKFFPSCGKSQLAEENGLLHATGFRPRISIRKAEEPYTVVIDEHGHVIESIELRRVGFTLYEGAIFVHQGIPYLVVHLDADLEFARVQRTHVKWTTRQRDYTDVNPIDTTQVGQIGPAAACALGIAQVTNVVFGYFKFDKFNRIIDAVDVNIPPVISRHQSLWINLPSALLDLLKLRNHHIAGSIHGAEHVLMKVGAAPGDMATECKAPEKEVLARRQTSRIRPARLILYETVGGTDGLGITADMFGHLQDLIVRSEDTISKCTCELGCSTCVASALCTERNVVLSKSGAQVVLRYLLGRGDELEDIPIGPEPNLPRPNVETVVPVGATTHAPGESASLKQDVKKEAGR